MNLLLDTHIAVWAVEDDKLLTKAARALMESADTLYVSTASIWEIAVKFALRRARPSEMPFSGYEATEIFEEIGFQLLPLEPQHVAAVGSLQHHHGDPFDRMIIAHALVEGLPLMTHDRTLRLYGDFVLVV